MTNALIVHSTINDAGNISDGYWWWCPGCDELDPGHSGAHMFRIPPWTFDGNYESPTFEASYLTWHDHGPRAPWRCHSFVRCGRIEYLSDSTHSLAGQTIDMVPVPDWLLH